MKELSTHENHAMRRIAFSYIFFLKALAYSELMANDEFPREEVKNHLEEFAELYNSDMMDLNSVGNDRVGERLFEIAQSDEFEEKYDIFLRTLTGEIFRLFACGAIAHEEGDIEIGGLPRALQNFYTKA